jgi:hypothetical protein
MQLTPQERVILSLFRSASLRFARVAAPDLDAQSRAAAVHSLMRKGLLARLGEGGEYWLTDRGVQALGLAAA